MNFTELVDGLIEAAKGVAVLEQEYRHSLADEMADAERELAAARAAVLEAYEWDARR